MKLFSGYCLFCFYLACSGCQLTGPDTSDSGSQLNILQPGDPWPQGDLFDLLSADIEGDILLLKVAYSGGCREHVFSFHSNGPVIKTLPPGADLIIYHDANNDTCEAWITEDLEVDLSPVRAPEHREVRIHIVDGGHNGDTTVSYRY